MHHRGLKVALVAVFTLVLVLGLAGIASAAEWPDLSLSTLGDYGITEAQVAQISDGYTDGTWKPYANMPRKQFVKMAVDAYQIPLVSPATPSYSDVPASHDYYEYVEAATAAGLTNGVGGGKFDPESTITREQAAAIIARWVAAKNGYNLDTMYSAAEITEILGGFGDGASVSASLKEEMAFAIDFGIVWGDATGMLAPLKAVTRIQGAAMLIRSWSIVPEEPPVVPVVPAKVELMSDDEAENLIGLTHQYTYKVTQADGSAAPGVLVDFDTLFSPWYVGNIQPSAGLTDANGEVTVNLISTEIGIQRVSAAAPGVAAIWSTKYWLALDEVYVMDETRSAQNNAGVPHTWDARVVVMGPGPLSTSEQDWYNAYDPTGDPSAPMPTDGIDWANDDDGDYAGELAEMAVNGVVPRSLPGIPVYAEIEDGTADITAAEQDGDIAADGQSAWMYTDADGMVSITIESIVANTAIVSFMADYEGNPYEGLLYSHSTDPLDDDHSEDWDPQPVDGEAYATKTWIPHVFGDNDTIIDPAYTYANIGEEFILTATLEDVYGNPIAGKQVEWFMQGIGHFVTDDDNTITDPTDPAGNKDIDVTDAAGQARVMVKSLMPGEQIVHLKFRDKGINGMEGQFMTFDAEVQWFDVNVVTFDDPATEDNEALAWNMVGTDHTFTLQVYGLKLEMDPSIDDPQQQTPYIDTDYPGRSYDGIIDAYDAAYFGGIFLVNAQETSDYDVTVQGRTLTVDVSTGISEYDWDQDGLMESFDGQTGIYLPLAGKDVSFARANDSGLDFSNLGEDFIGDDVDAVGSFTPDFAVTDANGEATVTVTSDLKGPETIEATVDWEGNPHNMSELLQAYAKKGWYAEDAVKIVVSIDETAVADNLTGKLNPWPVNPMYDENGDPGSAHIEVHVYDQFGNDLPDYEVVYLLENVGTTLNSGGQLADATYLPNAYFMDLDTDNDGDDQNGPRPDANEPILGSDPYATIVGDGGTKAFYFNQWLGAAIPGSPTANRRNTDAGHTGWVRGDITDLDITRALADIDYNESLELNQYPFEGLMTDGAKAWTLDGYRYDYIETTGDGPLYVPVVPNGQTGSHIDVQLAEYPDQVDSDPNTRGIQPYPHFKSIVKVMVYAPADGVVIDQAPIWHYQVHKVWEAPVATTIVLAPDADVNPVWYGYLGPQYKDGTLGVVATVYDQFGQIMAGQDVEFYGVFQEGGASGFGYVTGDEYDWGMDTTTGYGEAFASDSSPVWGVWNVYATSGDAESNIVTLQWGQYVGSDIYMGSDIYIHSSNLMHLDGGWGDALHGLLFNIHASTPDGTVANTGDTTAYDNNNYVHVGTTIPFEYGDEVWVNFPGSSNTDDAPNWVYTDYLED